MIPSQNNLKSGSFKNPPCGTFWGIKKGIIFGTENKDAEKNTGLLNSERRQQ